jgi:hypothetical protein
VVGETPLVFISHSGDDTWVARQLAAKITASGARTFLDIADIQFADAPDEKIYQALMDAAELVVLLTPSALDRPWVWMEISLAHFREPSCPIIVLLQGLSRRDFLGMEKVPAFLKPEDIIPLNEVDRYFDNLKMRIRGTGDDSKI